MAKSLYEEIEEIKNDRKSKDDIFTSHASHASQDALSLCNDVDNFVTQAMTSTSQARHKQDQGGFPESWNDSLSSSLPAVQVQADPSSLEDRLMNFYTVKLESIARQYQDGGIEWIMQTKPDLYHSLCQADNRVDEVWKSALAGGTTVADFEAAVNAWYKLQIEGIRLYRDALPKPESKPEQTISACPCCHESNWWVSVYDVKICGVCHPPGAAKMVKKWLGEVAPGNAMNINFTD